MEIDFNRQLQEFREEQENDPHNPVSIVGQVEVEEDLLSLAWDPEDFNFMESYIIIDLPWPAEELE